jgi:hypothetical protein
MVSVNARTNQPIVPGSSYFLIVGPNALNADPFTQQDVRQGANTALQSRGLVPAQSLKAADLYVKVDYMDFAPETYQHTTVVPVTGIVSSGGTSTFQATTQNVYPRYGQSSTYGRIYTPPQYGTVGAVPVTRTHTIKTWGVVMSAANARESRTDNYLAWYTSVVVVNPDSRKALDIAFKTIPPWLAKDSQGNRMLSW